MPDPQPPEHDPDSHLRKTRFLGGRWTPLDRPDHPLYQEVLAECENLPPEDGRAFFREICEADYPFFMLHAHSFGRYLCQQRGHPHEGRPWATWPWQWERLLEVHDVLANRRSGDFFNWARGHHKTGCVTEGGGSWIACREEGATILVVTWKADQTGVAIHKAVRREWEENKILHAHWPEKFTPEAIGKFTNKQLTLARRPGPREPTFSVYGIDGAPVSQHFTIIFVDDVVVKATVATAEAMNATEAALNDLVALSGQNVWIVYVGTIWHANDPWMRMIRDEKLRRHHHACYYRAADNAKGKWDKKRPTLFTAEHIEELRTAAGPWAFSAHYLGEPIPDQDQQLHLDWLRYYQTDGNSLQHRIPLAKGLFSYLVFDTAEGEATGDMSAFGVFGLGAEKSITVLDLWRDRLDLVEIVNLVFELNEIWPLRCTYLDGYRGSKPYYDAILERQRREGWRFPIRMLPPVQGSKEERIAYTIPMFESGRLYFPATGFGRTGRKDKRDVLQQFKDDEYVLWRVSGDGGGMDDILDIMAWLAHPETKPYFRWPRRTKDVRVRSRWQKLAPPPGDPLIPGLEAPMDETGVPPGISPWGL